MKHEGFDFTKNIWSENEPMSNEKDAWAGNIAVPHLIFDDEEKFKNNNVHEQHVNNGAGCSCDAACHGCYAAQPNLALQCNTTWREQEE